MRSDEPTTATAKPPARTNADAGTYDPAAHTPGGQSLDWGPCCTCGATDADANRCPNCPGERIHQMHSLAFKANAGSDPAVMDPNVLVRAAHENHHQGCDVCINCVNLNHAPAAHGAPMKRT